MEEIFGSNNPETLLYVLGKGAAKHPKEHRTTPTTKNYSAPK